MSLPLTLRQLEYFVAVARAASMASAANTLHVSPAAVSLGIAQLERTVGAPLFLRVRHRPLALTPAGRDLLPNAIAVVSEAEEFQARIHDTDTALAGTVYLGCFTTLGPFVVPRLVAAVAAEHPLLRVEVEEGSSDELQQSVLDATSEFAILYGLDLRRGLSAETVASISPYVVLPAGHRLARRRALRLTELADEPLIVLDAPPSRHHVQTVLADAGIDPPIERVTQNFETLRSFVARGHGWGILVQRPRSDTSYDGLELAAVPIADAVEPARVVIATAEGARLSRRGRTCLDVLRPLIGDALST